MENINKVISFILGFIIVVVFLLILSGRFRLQNRIPFIGRKTPTVTPSKAPTPTRVQVRTVTVQPTHAPGAAGSQQYNGGNGGNGSGYVAYNNQGNSPLNNVNQIPNTGAPTLLLPFAVSAFAGGVFLKRKNK